MIKGIKIAAILALAFATPTVITPTTAQANVCSASHYNNTDIDCAIILCLAGGFSPSECGAAASCAFWRIAQIPPKPMVGICSAITPNVNLRDDDPAAPAATIDALRASGSDEVADSLQSVNAILYQYTTQCNRGRDNTYDCTYRYAVNGDGSDFKRGFVEGNHRGYRVNFTDFEGNQRTIGTSESQQREVIACGGRNGDNCSYRTYWVSTSQSPGDFVDDQTSVNNSSTNTTLTTSDAERQRRAAQNQIDTLK